MALVALAAHDAGYPVPTSTPVALIVLALLGATLLGVKVRVLPRALVACLVALVGLAAWSYASMLWADDPAGARDAANLVVFGLLAFALAALSLRRAPAAAAVLAAWTLGVGLLGVLTLVGLARGEAVFYAGRLVEPVGYANANAALWLMGAWPGVVLAGRGESSVALRAVLTATAVMLAGLALLTLSRGAVVSGGVTLLLILVAVPGRARTLGVLAVVAAAVGMAAPTLLDLADAQAAGASGSAGTAAAGRLVLAALAGGLAVGWWAALERVIPADARRDRLVRRTVGALGASIALAGGVFGVVAVGDPVERAGDLWASFRDYGPDAVRGGRARLGSVSNSARYDFYRVAVGQFEDHPVGGAGAGNFEADYRAQRRTGETPRFPHSAVLAVLGQTGVVGGALLTLLVGGVASLGLRALRSGAPAARPVAGAGLAASVSFAAHASIDWLWQFPALGGAALACAGLACGLAPRRAERGAIRAPSRRDPVLTGCAALAALLVAALLVPPWLAEREVRFALETWSTRPAMALGALDRAASIDRLAARPQLLAGTLRLRAGRPRDAAASFAAVLERDPRNAYATVRLGALAARMGDRARALALLRRALALDPRNADARWALAQVREEGLVDLDELERRAAGTEAPG